MLDVGYWKFALRYAFRNLWRNSRRTTLTILTVLFAVGVAIIAHCYSTAVLKLWQAGAADTGVAEAQIHAAGYWEKQEGVQIDLTLAEDGKLEKLIKKDSHVRASVRRLELEGIIAKGDDEGVYFLGKGVEPKAEMRVSPRLFTKNDEGVFVSDANLSGVVVGKGLSETLGLRIGDAATLITQTVRGSVNGIDVEVVGIVDAAVPSFSQRVVYVHIKHLQRLIRLQGRYTELALRFREDVDIERWVDVKKNQIAAMGGDVRGWWTIEPTIRNIERIWDSVVMVISALLFLSTALSVLNIIFMMVAERTVEVGTLMAIGARPGDVRKLFSLEGTLIGTLGGLFGIVAGNLIVIAMGIVGVPFDSPFGSGQVVIYPEPSAEATVIVFAIAVLICNISAHAPARKAALVEPVRAFRGQLN